MWVYVQRAREQESVREREQEVIGAQSHRNTTTESHNLKSTHSHARIDRERDTYRESEAHKHTGTHAHIALTNTPVFFPFKPGGATLPGKVVPGFIAPIDPG